MSSNTAQYTTEYHKEKYDPKESLQFSVEDQTAVRAGDVASLNNKTEFAPRYYPKNVEVSKERDLVREKGICLGEWVNDVGAKNREVRISGYVISPELENFHEILDLGDKYRLICMQWQGEVLLGDASLKGPYGVDIDTKHWMYEYTLNFVSTGKSEGPVSNDGIIE